MSRYLAGKDEAEEDGDGELAVTEEDDVQQVRVGWVLQEKPKQNNSFFVVFQFRYFLN